MISSLTSKHNKSMRLAFQKRTKISAENCNAIVTTQPKTWHNDSINTKSYLSYEKNTQGCPCTLSFTSYSTLLWKLFWFFEFLKQNTGLCHGNLQPVALVEQPLPGKPVCICTLISLPVHYFLSPKLHTVTLLITLEPHIAKLLEVALC